MMTRAKKDKYVSPYISDFKALDGHEYILQTRELSIFCSYETEMEDASENDNRMAILRKRPDDFDWRDTDYWKSRAANLIVHMYEEKNPAAFLRLVMDNIGAEQSSYLPYRDWIDIVEARLNAGGFNEMQEKLLRMSLRCMRESGIVAPKLRAIYRCWMGDAVPMAEEESEPTVGD